uniref:Fibronectin type-III domain-containing protein n=3 Tax=Iconisemion striatum TaxID=60296 RepID=A0A1A7XNL9_9TELE
MDFWPFKLHLIIWTLMNFLHLFHFELTVKNSQLKPCEKNKRLCVTDPGDCDLRPPSLQRTLNVSCSYQIITNRDSSVSCDWSPESDLQSEVSLIFSSRYEVSHCRSIFNPAAILNVTVRVKNYRTGMEFWSQPHTIFLSKAFKPPQPAGVSVLGPTEDSLVVSWYSSHDGHCRLRYRPDNAHGWTQAADSLPAHANLYHTYTIRNLLPFKVYRASVACRKTCSIWSDWSSDTNGRTLDREPSRPSVVCYRAEKTVSSRSRLHLKWKAPEPDESGGRILGYQVSIHPNEQIHNLTETTAVLMVEDGNSSATVRAFNTAGFGSAALLQINTRNHITVPSVRNLWVSSFFPGNQTLLVQWAFPSSLSSSPIGHVSVEWHEEKSPSASRWSRVDSAVTSAVIRDVDPEESYLVSVFPVFNQQCGSAQSLAASLQLGALMEAVDLKVVGTNKTTVTVMWAWQRKSDPIRVKGYRVMLRRDSDTQTLPLWPDQRQHTFFNLTPNTEYSLLLLADGAPKSTVTVTTHFDEVPVVATAIPVLLLAVAAIIISILSRTAYKSLFFPPISSPRLSTSGRWLMSPDPKKYSERNILKIRDFEVTDVLGNKSLILLSPKSQISSEDHHEDSSLLSTRGPGNTSNISPDVVFETGPIAEQLSYRHGVVVYTTEESTCDVNCCSSQNGRDTDQRETAEKVQPREFSFLADFLRKAVSETTTGLADSSRLICEMEYLANGCIRPETAES